MTAPTCRACLHWIACPAVDRNQGLCMKDREEGVYHGLCPAGFWCKRFKERKGKI